VREQDENLKPPRPLGELGHVTAILLKAFGSRNDPHFAMATF